MRTGNGSAFNNRNRVCGLGVITHTLWLPRSCLMSRDASLSLAKVRQKIKRNPKPASQMHLAEEVPDALVVNLHKRSLERVPATQSRPHTRTNIFPPKPTHFISPPSRAVLKICFTARGIMPSLLASARSPPSMVYLAKCYKMTEWEDAVPDARLAAAGLTVGKYSDL